jgi:hypothetical protein
VAKEEIEPKEAPFNCGINVGFFSQQEVAATTT